jgi:hypothetical protein
MDQTQTSNNNLSMLFASYKEAAKNIAFWNLLGLDTESLFFQGKLVNYVDFKTEMFSQKNSHLPLENVTTISDNVVLGVEKSFYPELNLNRPTEG